MTSSILLAVSLCVLGADATNLSWQKSYDQARTQATQAQKPLAVVLGQGAEGRDRLSEQARQALAQNFVCVYVDTNTPAGQQQAQAFEINGASGLVLSDRTGQLQAFRHTGNLADSDLVSTLQRVANPQHVVNTTETVESSRVSFYPSAATTFNGIQQAPFLGMQQGYGGYQQSNYGMFQPSFGGGGCANGRCGR